ncbi:MAG: TraB/GumN family protein [Alphaproteobacteria bacterium]
MYPKFLYTIIFGLVAIQHAHSSIIDADEKPVTIVCIYGKEHPLTQEFVFEDSFKTQFRDLRLVDDSIGFGKLMGRIDEFFESERIRKNLKRKEDAINPLFFKLTKENRSFFILGTIHCLPLDILPQAVKDMIFKCNILVTERTVDSTHNVDHLEQTLNYYFDADSNWFDRLTPEEQKHLHTISPISPEYLINRSDNKPRAKEIIESFSKHTEISIEKIRLDIIVKNYLALHYENGMDLKLSDRFQELSRSVFSLESAEETINRPLWYPSPEEQFQGLKEVLGVEGGFLSDEDIWKISHAYLSCVESFLDSSDKSDDDDDDDDDDEQVIKDNNLWWPRIIETAKVVSSETMLVGVGLSHLDGPNGILYKLITEGCFAVELYTPLQGWIDVTELIKK